MVVVIFFFLSLLWKIKEEKERSKEREENFPELVKTGEDKYLTLDYTNLTPVLINAIKELSKKIDEVKKENEELRKEIKSIGK